MTISDFKVIIENAKDIKIAISLDWLSVLFTDKSEQVPKPSGKDEILKITDSIVLRNFGKGTKDYGTVWEVLYYGQHLATLLAHSHNPKFIKKDTCKVDFKNNLLYSSDIWPFYDELTTTFKLQYKNISRVDIAIDGCNYLIKFMNEYVKQKPNNKAIELKGRRQRVNCNVLERQTMMYQNFKVGSTKKVITIYNKSLDIVKTGKNYIQEFWKSNGVVRELMPIEILANMLTKDKQAEKHYIDGYENIYRFEIRLSGEIISQIKGFQVNWLKDQHQMMSIAKRLMQNFFEFVYFTRADVSKCEVIDLIPFDRWNIKPIELLPKKDLSDLYKTKLSLKKNLRQLYLGTLSPADYAATEMIIFDVYNFDLQEWFLNRLPQWQKEYRAVQPDKEIVKEVDDLLLNICTQITKNQPAELLV